MGSVVCAGLGWVQALMKQQSAKAVRTRRVRRIILPPPIRIALIFSALEHFGLCACSMSFSFLRKTMQGIITYKNLCARKGTTFFGHMQEKWPIFLAHDKICCFYPTKKGVP
jgi:hypothetical protein